MKKHILTIVISIIAGILLLSMLGKKLLTTPYMHSAQEQMEMMVSPESSFSLYELALAVKSNNPNILFIDIRTEDQYQQGHLPNAINVPIDMLFHSDYAEYIEGRSDKVKVLYANNEAEAIRANVLLTLNGLSGFRVLDGGFSVANNRVVTNPTPSFFHYSDEKMRHSYGTLMPNGAKTAQPLSKEVVVDVSVPRGGC
jgi:rhodanese-related sulfurtransferase